MKLGIYLIGLGLCIQPVMGCSSKNPDSPNGQMPPPAPGLGTDSPSNQIAWPAQPTNSIAEPSFVAESIQKACTTQFPSSDIQSQKKIPNLIGIYSVNGQTAKSAYIILDTRGYYFYYTRTDTVPGFYDFGKSGWLTDFDSKPLVDEFSFADGVLAVDQPKGAGGRVQFQATKISDLASLPADMRALLAIQNEACNFANNVNLSSLTTNLRDLGLTNFFKLSDAYQYLDVIRKFNQDIPTTVAYMKKITANKIDFWVNNPNLSYGYLDPNTGILLGNVFMIGSKANDRDGQLVSKLKAQTLTLDTYH